MDVYQAYLSLLYGNHTADSLARLAGIFVRHKAYRLAEEAIVQMAPLDYPRAEAAMAKLVEMIEAT